MNVKKIKRKCGIAGCKNTESYAISVTRDFRNPLILCQKCVIEILKEMKNYGKPKPVKPAPPDKPLFYGHLMKPTESHAVNTEETEPLKNLGDSGGGEGGNAETGKVDGEDNGGGEGE